MPKPQTIADRIREAEVQDALEQLFGDDRRKDRTNKAIVTDLDAAKDA
ncbi:hypothetical protein [Paracoccus sp. (in: a-proteobacteria)]